MPLTFVPTPLGNLRDITSRALDALRDCTLIVAEDSRVARKLLSALKIPGKEIFSYREQNAHRVTGGILQRAREEHVAVISDAGMPGISDPGTELVAAAREAGITVDVLPGPSAAIGAALLSGFPLRRFTFEGFPPRSKTLRQKAFRGALELGIASIWFESPKRIAATLNDLAAVDPAADVFLVREYTKRFEQQLSGNAQHVRDQLTAPVRGEVTFVVLPSASKRLSRVPRRDIDAQIDALLAKAQSVASIAKTLAAQGFGSRRDIYARAGERKRRKHQATTGKER
ncbi:MAG TPA: 16S rRNA (cytidine(1402)-2'-O)-methyltransferase [Candidatus Rubrimentiphilum sp.]|nr:16S rRNA (cytidine(1402)-2'-O)-methyltransferase [Candidatus Rubrimentiphilum sp.]